MTSIKPKRVCFPFVGDTIGGSHLSALLLIDALDRSEFDPVIALHQEGPFAEYLSARNIRYLLAPKVDYATKGPMYKRFWVMLCCARKLVPFLRREGIGIVHTNDVRMHLTWGLSARLAGAKFVWHQRTRVALGRAAYFGLLANVLFVISDYCRNGYAGILNRKAQKLRNPVSVKSAPVEKQCAREQIRHEIGAPAAVKIVGFVGNLRDQKRPEIFIRAAAALRDHYGARVKCLLFGEERMPTAAQLRELIAELGLEDICLFMGSRFPVEPWLAGCDLIMTPAVNEGYGRVLIEAMIVGTPVVASNDAGHKEIIEDGVNGYLVAPDNPSAFADAAIELLDNPKVAAGIAETAQQPAIELHSPQQHTKTVQRCYSNLFEKQPGGKSEADITFIIHDMRGGGAQRVALNLMRVWIDQGKRVQLITWLAEDTDFFELPAGVRRTVIGPKPLNAGRLAAHVFNLKAIGRIRQELRANSPKAVVSFITVTNIFVILAAAGLGRRLIISERNDPTRQNAGLIWGTLRRLLYRFADVVTANTAHAVEAMTGYVPRKKLRVVHNPVVIPDSADNSTRSPTVLNVGRLVPQKNQGLIISALKLLGETALDWRLEILGEGPLRTGLTEQARADGLEERVAMPGSVSDPDAHYKAAGIFVLSSAYEGTPNVLLEAMSHGLSCIVSDSLPGALEYVEHDVSGLVFRSGDAAHLAECLAMLMEREDLRHRLGAEARRRVEDYSVEKVAAQWDELLFS